MQKEKVVGGGGLCGLYISGNRDSQLASISILNDFTDDVLTTSADSLLLNGTVRILNFRG